MGVKIYVAGAWVEQHQRARSSPEILAAWEKEGAA
jgi:hypothetical protein